MKKAKGQGLEAIAIKRAKVADADKVRYRVYRSENDFIAVIAESALMAMKVSGITTPFRIVRDLPNEGIAVEAKKMAKVEETDVERIMFPIEPPKKMDRSGFLKAELTDKTIPLNDQFVPMNMGDLKKKPLAWARILTPDMVDGLKQLGAKDEPKPAAPVQAPPPPAPEPEPEPAIATAELEVAPVANEVAPSSPPSDHALTEEEVQKLLNS